MLVSALGPILLLGRSRVAHPFREPPIELELFENAWE